MFATEHLAVEEISEPPEGFFIGDHLEETVDHRVSKSEPIPLSLFPPSGSHKEVRMVNGGTSVFMTVRGQLRTVRWQIEDSLRTVRGHLEDS